MMRNLQLRLGLPALLLLATLTNPALADPIAPGTTFLNARAIQDITLLKNTVFNGTDQDILIDDLFGDGYLKFNRAAQVGSSIEITSLEGLFYGSNAMLGSYVFGSIPPLVPTDFFGSITNVVQDPTDPGFATGDVSSFVSGDVKIGGASFGFSFVGGPSLYTDPLQGFEFSAAFDGLPPSPGTVLQNSGRAVLDVYFNGMLVARSSDRRIIITSVPEPASLALLGTGALTLLGAARSRRRGR